MSIILGLNVYHADTSACIIKDGELISAVEEERIDRIKHSYQFPINSINECLDIGKINKNQITDIAYNTNPYSNSINKILFLLKNIFFFKKNLSLNRIKKKFNLKNTTNKYLGLNDDIKHHFIEHHIAHIASAYYPSNFDNAVGLSIDGSGDFVTIAIAKCMNKEIKIIKKIYFPHSLGIFYQSMTQFLGYRNFGDEYKIMGLAAYGKPIYFDKLKKIFYEGKNFFKLNLDFFNDVSNSSVYDFNNPLNISDLYTNKLKFLFAEDLQKSSVDEFNNNFAASVQKIYEYFFIKILNYCKKLNISKNLVLSGGCGLNSSANNILLSKKIFDNIFIPIAPGDNGGALGSAFYVAAKKFHKIVNANKFYLGKEYKSEQILDSINNNKLKNNFSYFKFENNEKLNNLVCDEIINGGVIGWFQGRMEFGPRALGNRSILADPRRSDMKNIINLKIKRRENYRPFAPSVLKENQEEWFEGGYDNLHMSSVMKVINEKSSLIPAVVHEDGTSRVQTVCKELNIKYYNLIKCFFKKTGIPMLLNTSFNENEPIVRSPEDAIKCFLKTNMDLLVLDNFVLKRIKN